MFSNIQECVSQIDGLTCVKGAKIYILEETAQALIMELFTSEPVIKFIVRL